MPLFGHCWVRMRIAHVVETVHLNRRSCPKLRRSTAAGATGHYPAINRNLRARLRRDRSEAKNTTPSATSCARPGSSLGTPRRAISLKSKGSLWSPTDSLLQIGVSMMPRWTDFTRTRSRAYSSAIALVNRRIPPLDAQNSAMPAEPRNPAIDDGGVRDQNVEPAKLCFRDDIDFSPPRLVGHVERQVDRFSARRLDFCDQDGSSLSVATTCAASRANVSGKRHQYRKRRRLRSRPYSSADPSSLSRAGLRN